MRTKHEKVNFSIDSLYVTCQFHPTRAHYCCSYYMFINTAFCPQGTCFPLKCSNGAKKHTGTLIMVGFYLSSRVQYLLRAIAGDFHDQNNSTGVCCQLGVAIHESPCHLATIVRYMFQMLSLAVPTAILTYMLHELFTISAMIKRPHFGSITHGTSANLESVQNTTYRHTTNEIYPATFTHSEDHHGWLDPTVATGGSRIAGNFRRKAAPRSTAVSGIAPSSRAAASNLPRVYEARATVVSQCYWCFLHAVGQLPCECP